VVIYDRTDVSTKHFDLAVVKEWSQIQNYYPLRLGKCFIIHPNMLFHMSFKVCSVFLSEEAISKLQLCNDKTWKQELADVIEKDNLLPVHGGTMTTALEHTTALKNAISPLTGSQRDRQILITEAHESGNTQDEKQLIKEQFKSWATQLENDHSKEADMVRKAITDLKASTKEGKRI